MNPPNWREIEYELVNLFGSFGRTTIVNVHGEPCIRYVRELAADGTIKSSNIGSLSLEFLARLIANKFRSTAP
jgi:hypothetical protein